MMTPGCVSRSDMVVVWNVGKFKFCIIASCSSLPSDHQNNKRSSLMVTLCHFYSEMMKGSLPWQSDLVKIKVSWKRTFHHFMCTGATKKSLQSHFHSNGLDESRGLLCRLNTITLRNHTSPGPCLHNCPPFFSVLGIAMKHWLILEFHPNHDLFWSNLLAGNIIISKLTKPYHVWRMIAYLMFTGEREGLGMRQTLFNF